MTLILHQAARSVRSPCPFFTMHLLNICHSCPAEIQSSFRAPALTSVHETSLVVYALGPADARNPTRPAVGVSGTNPTALVQG